MKEIKLTFEWDGKTVHKEASGFEGRDCTTATSFIETALGIVVEQEMKSEFYLPNPEGLDAHNKVYT